MSRGGIMAKLILEVEGSLPEGVKPTTFKVEPEMGTFELKAGDTHLAYGQLPKLDAFVLTPYN
jgi:hypothetical protein